jgi:bifunctional ADP-heptose synthase (sugar kinase/adenylyltransferase)
VKLDTRRKIIDTAEARRQAAAGAQVVSGYFDPLTAAHARRLAELKREGARLLIAIAMPADVILPARARAELVAALAAVDYVTESVDGLDPAVRLEAEDEARRAALIRHVNARQSAVS